MHDLTTPNPEDIKDTQALRNALYLTKKRDEVKGMWLDNLCGDNREEYIWDNGVAQGMAQGERNAKLEDARNFFNNGVSIDLIAKSIGFTVEEVKDIVGAN